MACTGPTRTRAIGVLVVAYPCVASSPTSHRRQLPGRHSRNAVAVADGQVWIDMLDHRNLLSHTYDETTFDAALVAVRDRYLAAIDELRGWLDAKRPE